MKKALLLGTLCLICAGLANAETVSGEVVKAKKNMIVIQTDDGEKMALHTTDNTNYRQKKISRKGKMKKGKITPADTYYEPMVEEDDWVEVTYTPATNEMQSAEVQEVIVYDN
ncbi:MAG: hypothetical protein J6T55_03530 [Alphaproteobacteria bacterium]|nr:hypothetical protein [Alphaproteobacteria bacterium]